MNDLPRLVRLPVAAEGKHKDAHSMLSWAVFPDNEEHHRFW